MPSLLSTDKPSDDVLGAPPHGRVGTNPCWFLMQRKTLEGVEVFALGWRHPGLSALALDPRRTRPQSDRVTTLRW
jgi:hypothetical protein